MHTPRILPTRDPRFQLLVAPGKGKVRAIVRVVTDRNSSDRRATVQRTLMGGLISLPQVAAWMFTASVVNLARQRVDVFFKPMWLAVVLIIIVLGTGALFVRGLWLYLRGDRSYTLAATGAVSSMTAAVGLAFVTAVYTF